MRLTKGRFGLVIPHRMNESPKHVCNVPGCDAVFYDGEERARINHSLEHANVDEEYIHEATRDTNEDILGPGDDEKQQWQRRRLDQLVGQVPDPLNPKHY